MRYAVISDIHCNFPILKQCVEDAIKHNVSQFIFLGDYVTDGYTGDMVVSYLKELSKHYPCEFIYGNREKYIYSYHEMDDEFNKRIDRISLGYESLSQESHKWLNSLYETKNLNIGGLRFLLIHGDCFNSNTSIYNNYDMMMEQYDFDVCLYGHTHELRNDIYKGKKFINPGTISFPKANDLSYCIIDVHNKEVAVTYRMIEVNQKLLNIFHEYYIETGYCQENKIWTEFLLNCIWKKYGYIAEFMTIFRKLCISKYFENVQEYNAYFQEEYEKFAKEKKLFRINDVKRK